MEWFGRRALLKREEIAAALSDDDVAVRCWAARTLAHMGIAAADQEDKVAKALRDSDAAVRCLATGIMVRLGEHAAGLAAVHTASVADSLFDDDPEVRRAAAFALYQMGDAAAAHAAKIAHAALKDPDVDVRRLAATTLERQGEQVSAYACELVGGLKDEDAEVRRWVARALEHIGRHLGNYALEIANAVRDPDPTVRMWALLTMARLGKAAKEHVQQVTAALGDISLANRCLAVGVLVQIDLVDYSSLATSHMPLICEALNSKDPEIRRAGALALALMGDAALDHLDEVARCLRDEDTLVRRGAARALLNMVENLGEEDVSKLSSLLDDKDAAVRLYFLKTLQRMHDDACSFADAVGKLALEGPKGDPHPAVRREAMKALPSLGARGAQIAEARRKERELLHVQVSPLQHCYSGVMEFVEQIYDSTLRKWERMKDLTEWLQRNRSADISSHRSPKGLSRTSSTSGPRRSPKMPSPSRPIDQP